MSLGAFGCIFMMKRENEFYENLLQNNYNKTTSLKKVMRKFKYIKVPAGDDKPDFKKMIPLVKELRHATQEDKKKILREFFKKSKDPFWHLPSDFLYKDEEDRILEAIASNPMETEEDWEREEELFKRLNKIDPSYNLKVEDEK